MTPQEADTILFGCGRAHRAIGVGFQAEARPAEMGQEEVGSPHVWQA